MDADQLTSRLLAHVASDGSVKQTRSVSTASQAPSELDQPSLARDLKQATAEAHEIVERHPSVDLLITGLIPKTLHTRYLICLWHIYSTLEASLDQLATHPALATTYNPALLSRASKLEDDIRYFLDLNHDQDWKLHPQAQVSDWPKDTQAALQLYVGRLKDLACGALSPQSLSDQVHDWAYTPPPPTPELLLSHAYVRYMGDMSGGQDIRKSIAAAYSLPLDLPDGQRFYEFGEKGFDIREIKQIKREFRLGLDKAGEHLSEQVYLNVLQEANHTFELNIRLFSSFASELPADFSYASSSSSSSSHHSSPDQSPTGKSSGGQCPFKHLQFAGQSAAHRSVQQVVSLPKSLRSILAAFIALFVALIAHHLVFSA